MGANVTVCCQLLTIAPKYGSYSLECTFRSGFDPDIDVVEVQNRVLQARDFMPRAVIDNGIIASKCTPTTLMLIFLYSPQQTFDSLFLSYYAQIQVVRSKIEPDSFRL